MWLRLALLSLCSGALVLAKEAEKKEAAEEATEEYKTPKQKRLEKEFKGFLEVETKLIDSINGYIDLEKKRLEKLKTLAENSEELKLDYIYNPVNVFKLIKRLVYSDVFAGMHENSADKVVGDLKDSLPTEESLRKAAVEVFRWQDKKEAKVKDLANGDLPDEKSIKPLTIDDCFHLGRMAYNDGDFYHGALWFEEAWERILLKKTATDKEKVPILDYLSFCYYRMGNIQRAYWMTKEKITVMDPENSRAKGNLVFYEDEMKEFEMAVPTSESDLPEIAYLTVKEIKKRDKELEKKRQAAEEKKKGEEEKKKEDKKKEKEEKKKEKKEQKKKKGDDKEEKKDKKAKAKSEL